MIRLFKRLRHIVGRRDGSRQAPRRPSSCTPISSTPSSLMPGCSSSGIQQAGAPRHMLRLEAAARPRLLRKPHSPAHADRGFLHGWLSYARQRPKPFTISAVRTGLVISQKPTFADPSTSVKGGVQRIVSVHGGIAPSARRRAAWTLVETPADTLQKVCSDQLHPPPQVDRSGAPARSATSCWACGNLLPGQI